MPAAGRAFRVIDGQSAMVRHVGGVRYGVSSADDPGALDEARCATFARA